MAVAQVGASKTATPLPDDKKKPEASNRNQPTTAKKIDASAGNTSTTKKYTPQSSKALDASASNTVLAKVDPKVDPKADPKSEKKSDPKSEKKSTTKPLDLEADTKGLDTKKVATSKVDATGVKDLTAGAEGVSKSQTKGDPKSETKSVSKRLDLEADTKGLDTKKVATSKVDATGVKDLTAGAEGVSKSQTKSDPKSETKSTTKPLDLEADTKGVDTKKVATSKVDATGVEDLTAGAEGVSKSQTKSDPKSETKSTTKPLDLEADTKGVDTKKVATSKVDATGVEDLTAGAEGVSKSQTKSDPKSETKSVSKPLDLEADTKGLDTKKVDTTGVEDLTAGAEGVPKSVTKTLDPNSTDTAGLSEADLARVGVDTTKLGDLKSDLTGTDLNQETEVRDGTTKPLDLDADTTGLDTKKVDATGVEDLTAGAEGVSKSQTKGDPKSETKSVSKPLDLEADTKGLDTKKVATSKVDATGVKDLTAGAEGVSKSQTKSDPKSETKSTTKPLDLEADTKGVDTKKVATSKVDATGVEDLTAGAEGVSKSQTKSDPKSETKSTTKPLDLEADTKGVDTKKVATSKVDATGVEDLTAGAEGVSKSQTKSDPKSETKSVSKPLDLEADTKGLDTKKVDTTGVEDLTAGAEGVPKSVTKTLDPNSTDTAGLSEADLARVGVDTTKLGDLKSDLTGTDLNQETEVRDGTTKPLDLDADTTGLDTKKVDATGVEDLTAGAEGVPKSVTKTLDPNSTDTAGLSEADLARVGVDTTKLGDLKSDLTGTDLNQETEVRDGTTKPLDLEADTKGLDTKKVDATGVEDLTAGAEGVPKSVTKTLDPNSTDTAGLSEADLARVGVDTTKLGDLKSDLTGTDLNQETEVRDGTTKPLDLDADTTGLDTKKVDATGVEDMTAGAEGVPKSVTKTLDPNSTDTAGLSEADLARVGVDTTKLGDLKSDLTGTDLNPDADILGTTTTKTLDPNSADIKSLDAKELATGVSLASTAADSTATAEKEGIIGYDENMNPILDSDFQAGLKPSELEKQKVDEDFASKDINTMLETMGKNERLNSEFSAYFNSKYKDKAASPAGMDIYANPENYTPEQKLTRYHELMKVKGEFEGYIDYRKAEYTGTNALMLNEHEARKDIDEAMKTLMADPDTAAAMTAEYLTGYKEILSGKRFQAEDKYDAAYDQGLTETKQWLQDSYETQLANGGIFTTAAEEGVNEVSANTRFKTTLNAYAAVLDADFIEGQQGKVDEVYGKFYNEKMVPLSGDPADNYKSTLYAYNTANMTPEDRKAIGLLSPTIDGKTYKDTGKGLDTAGWSNTISNYTLDDDSKKLATELGLDKKLQGDGVDAVYLKTAANVAEQVYGKDDASKADRGKFVNNLLTELRPLASQDKWENGAESVDAKLKEIQTRLVGNGSTAEEAATLATALNGMVRGSGLANSTLLQGMGKAGTGLDLKDVQAMVAIGTGYEGKGLAEASPDGNARTIFGTTNRGWEGGVLGKFGKENVGDYTDKMSRDLQSAFKDSNITRPVLDVFDMTTGFKRDVMDPLASSMADGIYGSDEAAKAKFMTRAPNTMHQIFSSLKPGGYLESTGKLIKDKLTTDMFFGDEKPGVSLDEKTTFMTKASTAFIAGTRTVHNALLNKENMTPSAIASTTIQATQAFGYTAGLVGSQIKTGTMDTRFLYKIGEYKDAAVRAAKQGATRVSGAISGLADVALLPAGIYNFVNNLKSGSMDNTEKVLSSISLAADAGVALDGAMTATRAFTSTGALQASRLGSMFFGAGGTVMGALGGAFNVISAAGYIGLALYQNIKEDKRADRMTDELEGNLSNLTDNKVWDHLDFRNYWHAGPYQHQSALDKAREEAYYKEDKSYVDWNAMRDANQQRYAALAGQG